MRCKCCKTVRITETSSSITEVLNKKMFSDFHHLNHHQARNYVNKYQHVPNFHDFDHHQTWNHVLFGILHIIIFYFLKNRKKTLRDLTSHVLHVITCCYMLLHFLIIMIILHDHIMLYYMLLHVITFYFLMRSHVITFLDHPSWSYHITCYYILFLQKSEEIFRTCCSFLDHHDHIMLYYMVLHFISPEIGRNLSRSHEISCYSTCYYMLLRYTLGINHELHRRQILELCII